MADGLLIFTDLANLFSMGDDNLRLEFDYTIFFKKYEELTVESWTSNDR